MIRCCNEKVSVNMDFKILILLAVTGVRCYLLDELFRNVSSDYQAETRPLCKSPSVTDVYIDFALRQIVDLDEPKQFLNSILWVRMEWEDCRLTWNASRYEGINDIIIPQNKVWVPDLTLYDNAAADKLSGIDDYNLVIHSNGVINFNFPSLLRSVCAVDVTHFPFDFQVCNLTFGSWAYSGRQVDVINVSTKADMTSYILNSEWHVYNIPVNRVVTYYGQDPYPTLVVQLLLERRPLFYALNLLFPCFLISSVAVLGFLLPPASGEKVSLEITVLLSLAVFQLIVLELMPPSGKVSFMGMYFIISMVLVGFSCLTTVIVLNIHFKGYEVRPLPRRVRRFILVPLARVMCVNVEKQKTQMYAVPVKRRRSSVVERKIPELNENGCYRFQSFDEVALRRLSTTSSHLVEAEQHLSQAKLQNGVHVSKQLVPIIENISEKLELINRQLEVEKEQFYAGFEWRTLALILDRMFMTAYILFLMCACLSLSFTFIIFDKAPGHWGDTN
ncbi:neuronal acetylcholine receptor subunit alpha-9-like [Mercenaria mercenaria]|uniref:neuronal acetylcholine receptor subunit alpha-9-like n=1 Tax=Mercenaria mercenaria TaxID=6596 RepID=UPI00234EE238|nr:neuronal acetylcholine receptor subunit alpha-9-like [Mercenaria mercenaria]